jgi:phosphoribosylformimino-5-aminoimidazole carboxamide ribotide isomerase
MVRAPGEGGGGVIVIPAIDLRGGKVVRLVEGDPSRQTVYSDDPVATALRFEELGAQWLHVVDLDAAFGTGSNGGTIGRISAHVSAQLQLGGGLRNDEAIMVALQRGAARIVLGTKATDQRFLRSVLDSHGDRVVVALDVRGGRAMLHGWREDGPPLEQLVSHLEGAGVARYLVTSVASDGRLEGPDLDLYRRILALTERPVIASGGISSTQDLKALSDLGVEAAIVGKALYEGRLDLADALQAVRA